MKFFTFKKKIYYSALILLFCQLFLSVFRLTYYIYKGITVDGKWLNLTSEEQRITYYGDEYIFFEKIRKIKTNSFYLLSKDGKAYFLGRYLLYPKRLFLITDVGLIKTNQYLLNFKYEQSEELLRSRNFVVVDIVRNDAGTKIGEVLIKK